MEKKRLAQIVVPALVLIIIALLWWMKNSQRRPVADDYWSSLEITTVDLEDQERGLPVMINLLRIRVSIAGRWRRRCEIAGNAGQGRYSLCQCLEISRCDKDGRSRPFRRRSFCRQRQSTGPVRNWQKDPFIL